MSAHPSIERADQLRPNRHVQIGEHAKIIAIHVKFRGFQGVGGFLHSKEAHEMAQDVVMKVRAKAKDCALHDKTLIKTEVRSGGYMIDTGFTLTRASKGVWLARAEDDNLMVIEVRV